jgi:hypothetical protein
MSNNTHTPGPWKANGIEPFTDYKGVYHNGLACAVWSADGETPIATCAFSVGRYNEATEETQDANARLIAEAPEMLELLKDTLVTLENTTSDEFSKGADKPIRDAIINLLNKLDETKL